MTNKNWIKNCLGYSNNKYTTEPGNGKAIKEYKEEKKAVELPDGNFIIITNTIPKLDEEGKQCYKNLYEDIQDQKDSVDFQKILNANMTIDQIQLAINNNKQKFDSPTSEKYGDFSDFATVEKLQKIKNETNKNGKNYNDFVKNYNNVINQYNQMYKNLQQKMKELKEQEKLNKYWKNNEHLRGDKK